MTDTTLRPGSPDDVVITAPAGHTAVLRNFNTDKTKVRIGFTPIVPPVDPPPPPPPDPDPGTDPPVPPGFTTITKAVTDAPIGAVIGIPAGLYRETVTPKAGQRLVPVGGSVRVDGQNSRQHAFVLSAAGVTLDRGSAAGAMFEAFDHRPPYQRGAFYVIGERDCTIRGAFGHHNPGNGRGQDNGNHNTIGGDFAISRGTGHLLEDVRTEDTETCGIHINGYGDGTTAGLGVVTVRRARGARLNLGKYNLGWHSGGLKATKVATLLVEDSTFTQVEGDGIWLDIDVVNPTLRRNRCDHASFSGIHYEISSGATIEDNVIWECGWGRNDWLFGAGIQVIECDSAKVRRNIVAWCNRGVSILNPNAPRPARGNIGGNRVESNIIVGEKQLHNWGDGRSGQLWSAAGNGGSGNRYWATAAEPQAERFAWQGGKSTLAAFNATPGDEGGTYLTLAERDAILTAAGIPLGRS